jgi:hypothetical protein
MGAWAFSSFFPAAADPLFRQLLILAYLIAGLFIGPFGTGWVKSQESISIISASDVLPCVMVLAQTTESG